MSHGTLRSTAPGCVTEPCAGCVNNPSASVRLSFRDSGVEEGNRGDRGSSEGVGAQP